MGDEEPVDGAVEDDDLHQLVGLQRGDGLIELRNGIGPKDIQRRHVERHPPVGRRVLGQSYRAFGHGRAPHLSVHAGAPHRRGDQLDVDEPVMAREPVSVVGAGVDDGVDQLLVFAQST